MNDETVTFQMWSRTNQKSPYVLDDEVSKVNVYQYRDKEKDDYFTKIANNFFYSIPFFETCVHEFNDLLNERIENRNHIQSNLIICLIVLCPIAEHHLEDICQGSDFTMIIGSIWQKFIQMMFWIVTLNRYMKMLD